MRTWLAGLAIALAAMLVAGGAHAAGRVALVIGNGAYQHVAHLPNPTRDADAVAGALRAAGFDQVTVLDDLDDTGMRHALADFVARAQRADIAVVYFAGHGMEVDGKNYLIPVDATLANAANVGFETVPLDAVMQVVESAHTLGLVLLDACRDDPFAVTMQQPDGAHRSVDRGLARVEPIGNTMVVYAARAGTVADDGNGQDSPFATALVKRLATPDLEVDLLFRKVRDDVLKATSRHQEPFIYGSLGGDPIYLMTGATAPTSPPPPARLETKEFIVYFPFDQYVLTPEAQQVVQLAAQYAQAGGAAAQVTVVGHDDGASADALRVSERRAKATADQMVAFGVSPSELAVDWKGAQSPAIQTAAGVREPLNRRAVIVVSFNGAGAH